MYLKKCPICNGEIIQKDYGCECQNCKEIFQYDDQYGFTTMDIEEYRRLIDEKKIDAHTGHSKEIFR